MAQKGNNCGLQKLSFTGPFPETATYVTRVCHCWKGAQQPPTSDLQINFEDYTKAKLL